MGIMTRIGTLVAANLNHLVSRAEDPELVLEQLVRELRDHLAKAKRDVAVSIADTKKLERHTRREEQLGIEWEKKALMAVRAGRDDLAKEALRRKHEHAELHAAYHEQWEVQHAASEQLKEALRAMARKIEEAEQRKRLIVMRKRQLEARRRIQDTIGTLQQASPMARIAEIELRIDDAHAQLEAEIELTEQAPELEEQFLQLEYDAAVDDDLARLKLTFAEEKEQTFLLEHEEVAKTVS